MPRRRLFIPGPTEVRSEIAQELARPAIGHRSSEFRELYTAVREKLRRVMATRGRVFLLTSSATGAWEAAVRNGVRERVLCAVQGAFSERWHRVAEANGKRADVLGVEPGRAIRAEQIDAALSKHRYDAVTIVHNETSTGVMNRLDEIAEVVRAHDDVLLFVDAVSSMAGAPLEVDALGADVVFAGVQKAFALPPGLTVVAVSERALERARSVPHRGYYFDWLELAKYDDRDMTPSTPAIPQIRALDAQLDAILAEGLEARFARHRRLAGLARAWTRDRFALFAEEGFASPTLTCVSNVRDVSFETIAAGLAADGAVIADGYGPLKDRTFRIAHMGDVREWELLGLLSSIDRIIGADDRPLPRGDEGP